MTASLVKELGPRLLKLQSIIQAGKATDGPADVKWRSNGIAQEIMRNYAEDQLIEIALAGLALVVEHGGRPKTRFVNALYDLATTLEARDELSEGAP